MGGKPYSDCAAPTKTGGGLDWRKPDRQCRWPGKVAKLVVERRKTLSETEKLLFKGERQKGKKGGMRQGTRCVRMS